MTNLNNALVFIIVTLFDFYIATVLLRVILQYVRAPFNNEIGQFVIKITNPGVIVLRKIIPSLRSLDLASLVFAYILAVLKIVLVNLLITRTYLPVNIFAISYFVLAFLALIEITLTIYFWAIIIRVIFSLLAQNPNMGYNAFYTMVYLITEPVLSLIRRFISPIGGFDLSPLIACLLIAVLRIIFNI
ncbi:MAG: YggT family protein [Gammaproteobacteria bacterium]|nr:YggT family protein [Gammaproteobacteria bacterium]